MHAGMKMTYSQAIRVMGKRRSSDIGPKKTYMRFQTKGYAIGARFVPVRFSDKGGAQTTQADQRLTGSAIRAGA